MSMVADPTVLHLTLPDVGSSPKSQRSQTGIFACGINSPVELVEKGENKNCRTYRVDGKRYVPNPVSNPTYVCSGYNPLVLWEHYVPVTWTIIRCCRAQLVFSLCLNVIFQRATSLSREGSFLLAAGLHVVSHTPSIINFPGC